MSKFQLFASKIASIPEEALFIQTDDLLKGRMVYFCIMTTPFGFEDLTSGLAGLI